MDKMKQTKPKGIRVGSSDPNRVKELRENHEKLQEMLANGYQIRDAKVKRPRIKETRQPKAVVVTLGGSWSVTLSYEDYQKRGAGLKIMMKIY